VLNHAAHDQSSHGSGRGGGGGGSGKGASGSDTGKVKSIKILDGHLTASDKKSVKALLDSGQMSGKVSKKNYFLKPTGGGVIEVTQVVKDRGLMPVPGSPLRMSTYKSRIQVERFPT
jgi:hypothetical protein